MEECVICMDASTAASFVKLVPCGHGSAHEFCVRCVDGLPILPGAAGGKRCPVCRAVAYSARIMKADGEETLKFWTVEPAKVLDMLGATPQEFASLPPDMQTHVLGHVSQDLMRVSVQALHGEIVRWTCAVLPLNPANAPTICKMLLYLRHKTALWETNRHALLSIVPVIASRLPESFVQEEYSFLACMTCRITDPVLEDLVPLLHTALELHMNKPAIVECVTRTLANIAIDISNSHNNQNAIARVLPVLRAAVNMNTEVLFESATITACVIWSMVARDAACRAANMDLLLGAAPMLCALATQRFPASDQLGKTWLGFLLNITLEPMMPAVYAMAAAAEASVLGLNHWSYSPGIVLRTVKLFTALWRHATPSDATVQRVTDRVFRVLNRYRDYGAFGSDILRACVQLYACLDWSTLSEATHRHLYRITDIMLEASKTKDVVITTAVATWLASAEVSPELLSSDNHVNILLKCMQENVQDAHIVRGCAQYLVKFLASLSALTDAAGNKLGLNDPCVVTLRDVLACAAAQHDKDVETRVACLQAAGLCDDIL